VLILEKNKRVGEKLRISGGGRCNITNAEPDERKFTSMYGKAEQYLYSLFSQFGTKDTFTFFESKKLPLVVQARQRAFPHTEKAEDVARVLEAYCKAGKVSIKTGAPVSKIHTAGGVVTGVSVGKDMYVAREYVLATGGVSHPETGSTGDGLRWLRDLGHTVHKPTPTIVPLRTEESWSHELAGVSLSFMKITFFVEGKRAFSLTGKVLFTHFGLSGPLILNASSKVSDLLYSGTVTATIDAYPDTDLGALDRRITAVFDTHKNKTFRNILKDIVPDGAARGILELVTPVLDIEKKVHSISRDERKALVRVLKALPVTVTGLMGFDRAVVADGGVPLDEVDMRTMRSKKLNNLFILGDLLHINRPSGGYSLQLCWSTGYVAGSSVAG
jgi:predicted Rossmann fold flavoprotein